MSNSLLLFLATMQAAGASGAGTLQTEAGPDFGDGSYQPEDHVTIHGVNNLEEGLRAKVIAYDPAKSLYVVKDADAKIWGVGVEKLRAMRMLNLDELSTSEWTRVRPGIVLPKGCDIRMDLETGERLVRKLVPDASQQEHSQADGQSACSSSS